MKVELLPSTVGEAVNRQFCIGAVIDESIAIDAGTLGMVWPLERQQKIDHVLLSHSHMDHIATLPLLLDNVYQKREHCPVIHGSEATIVALRQHIFNNSIWPDFVRLSEEETPFLELRAMNDEEELRCGNLTITPVSLNHIVPTSGFVVRHPEAAVAFISDTRPTQRIWELLSSVSNLRAVFLECSFPNSHRVLADKSGHLCPEQFAGELDKFGREDVEIGQPGQCYVFG
jgi:cAMP phosphodiesterase